MIRFPFGDIVNNAGKDDYSGYYLSEKRACRQLLASNWWKIVAAYKLKLMLCMMEYFWFLLLNMIELSPLILDL